MKTPTLTDTQKTLFLYAIEHTKGLVIWMPPEIKGGAQQKVLTAMVNRGLVEKCGGNWAMTALAYSLLGRAPIQRKPKRAKPTAPAAAPDRTSLFEQDVKLAEQQLQAPEKPKVEIKTRANSKQAQVIALLQRPEGATINQICELTKWQAHTVRGTMAGTFKTKLGLVITSDKPAGGERIYKIASLQTLKNA